MVEGEKKQQRPRGYSGHFSDLSNDDIHIMKLMEEMIELDQGVKLKQEFIRNRMNMLNGILKKEESEPKQKQIKNFLQKFNHYPKSLREREEVIAMGMDAGEPIAMGMDAGNPIAMPMQESEESAVKE